MKRVLLVIPPMPITSGPDACPPLSIGYVAALFRQRGVDTCIVDFNRWPLSLAVIEKAVLEYKPDLLAITCCDLNYTSAKYLMKISKEVRPDLPIMLGGPTATFEAEAILADCPHLDFVVHGSGIQTLDALSSVDIEKRNDLFKIPNIKFMGSSCKGVVFTGNNSNIGFPRNLDELPSPFANGVFMLDDYAVAGVTSVKGCEHSCIFCCVPSHNGFGLSANSVERVMLELEIAQMHGIKSFMIFDSVFTRDAQRVERFCQAINRKKITGEFHVETRADQCSRRLFQTMASAGILNVSIGLETSSEIGFAICRKTGRAIGSSQWKLIVEHAVNDAVESGINISVNLILGLPGESYDSSMETIEFAKRLGVTISPNILVPYSGTPIVAHAEKYGINIQRDPNQLLPYRISKFDKLSWDEVEELLNMVPPSNDYSLQLNTWFGEAYYLATHGYRSWGNPTSEACAGPNFSYPLSSLLPIRARLDDSR